MFVFLHYFYLILLALEKEVIILIVLEVPNINPFLGLHQTSFE